MEELTQTKLAGLLGQPKSRLTEWKKRGCPVDDVEAARDWIRRNIAPRAKRGKAGSQNPPPTRAPAGEWKVPDVADGDLQDTSWDAKIKRAHAVETLLYSAVKDALGNRDHVKLREMLSSYLKSFGSIAEAERSALKIQRERRELLPIAEAKKVLAEILTPIRSALEGLPLAERSRCNPTSPEVAEAALKAWSHALLSRVSQAELVS